MTKMLALLLAAMGSLPCCAPFEIGDIEHFLVLVMENRPFDHFYGFASSQLGDIDGLTGEECMPYDPTDPGGESECVAEGEAKYVCEGTGSLSYDTVVEQVFGFNADGTPVWDGVSKYCPNGTSVDVDWCATGTSGTASAGTACAFPFQYDGQSYDACIGDDYGGKGWCATTGDYDKDGAWGGCTYCEGSEMCADGKSGNAPKGTPCSFPFEYGGYTYEACKGDSYGGKGWCSTDGGDFDDATGAWGGCAPCGALADDTADDDECVDYPPSQPQNGWMVVTPTPEVIHQFTPEQIPVHMALAEEFAVFDKYYTSFPGPSTPNHLFIMSATAAGCTYTGCESTMNFSQRTIFESVADAGLEWRYYYNDSAWNSFLTFFGTPEGAAGTVTYDEFYDRAAKGTLPNFSFILPREGTNETTGEGSNDDHPCHDIALGEKLIKETYEALRAGPGWNKTLLLITYDDTGGWYDHGALPVGVPAPDDIPFSDGAAGTYTWLGLRAPSLLVSPWLRKGKVIHEPDGPAPDSQYEHSSIAATAKNLFGLPDFLTRRDAWAGSFEKELELDAPRTDCPMHLPDAPAPATGREKWRATHGGVDPDSGELTRRMLRRVAGIAAANGVDVPEGLTHRSAEQFINAQEDAHRANAMAKKAEL